MFTHKTVKVTRRVSDKVLDAVDNVFDKVDEIFDEVFKKDETTESVETTIRIRMTPQQVDDLKAGRTLTFKAQGITILLEGGK